MFQFVHKGSMNIDTRTYEDKNSLSIFLPAFDHLVVFFYCGLGIQGEDRLRAVTNVRFYLQWLQFLWFQWLEWLRWLRWLRSLIRCRLDLVTLYFIYIRELRVSKRQGAHTWVIPLLEVWVSMLRH